MCIEDFPFLFLFYLTEYTHTTMFTNNNHFGDLCQHLSFLFQQPIVQMSTYHMYRCRRQYRCCLLQIFQEAES